MGGLLLNRTGPLDFNLQRHRVVRQDPVLATTYAPLITMNEQAIIDSHHRRNIDNNNAALFREDKQINENLPNQVSS